jgi:hypothetical protein
VNFIVRCLVGGVWSDLTEGFGYGDVARDRAANLVWRKEADVALVICGLTGDVIHIFTPHGRSVDGLPELPS